MIVRISLEGQYRVDEALIERLNELDNEIVDIIARGDEEAFKEKFHAMLELVRQNGELVPPEEIVPSDLVLPPPDLTLEEARAFFTGEGVIPG